MYTTRNETKSKSAKLDKIVFVIRWVIIVLALLWLLIDRTAWMKTRIPYKVGWNDTLCCSALQWKDVGYDGSNWWRWKRGPVNTNPSYADAWKYFVECHARFAFGHATDCLKQYYLNKNKEKLVSGEGVLELPEMVIREKVAGGRDRIHGLVAVVDMNDWPGGVKKLVLPESINTVVGHMDSYALCEVEAPGLTTIGDGFFSDKKNLRKIDLSSVENIGANAFENCIGLNDIILENVKSLGEGAFKGCTGLKEVKLLYATELRGTFEGCTSLVNADVPAATILDGTFIDCTSLSEVNAPLTEEIPQAFSGCSALEEVSLPQIKSIGENSFMGCQNLMRVECPQITSIGKQAFMECVRLSEIDLSNVTHIEDGSFYGCESLVELDFSSLTHFGAEAFRNCTGIKEVVVKNPVYVGARAFYNCKSLEKIVLPDITEVWDEAFGGCSKLRKAYVFQEHHWMYIWKNTGNDIFPRNNPKLEFFLLSNGRECERSFINQIESYGVPVSNADSYE